MLEKDVFVTIVSEANGMLVLREVKTGQEHELERAAVDKYLKETDEPGVYKLDVPDVIKVAAMHITRLAWVNEHVYNLSVFGAVVDEKNPNSSTAKMMNALVIDRIYEYMKLFDATIDDFERDITLLYKMKNQK